MKRFNSVSKDDNTHTLAHTHIQKIHKFRKTKLSNRFCKGRIYYFLLFQPFFHDAVEMLMTLGSCCCLVTDCLNHLKLFSHLFAIGGCIPPEAEPFLFKLLKLLRGGVPTFHFYIFSTCPSTRVDRCQMCTGWKLVAWGFLWTQESLNFQW